jgi:hypothetical protein
MRQADLTVLSAGAIKTVVFGTNAAYLGQLFSYRFSRPVETHRGIVRCCVLQSSEQLGGLASKVYMLDRFPVSLS